MRKSLLAITALTTALLIAPAAQAFYGGPGKQVPVEVGKDGAPMGYYEYLPKDYVEGTGKKFPVVFFMHGYGERGSGKLSDGNLQKVLNNAIPNLIKNGKHFPAIVVSPQIPGTWFDHALANKFIEHVFKMYPAADRERLYVTGLSNGGAGTFYFMNHYADKVAAAVPIASGVSTGYLTNPLLVDLPIWAFHSYDDTAISFNSTMQSLQKITPPNDYIRTGYSNATDALMIYSRSTAKHSWQTGVKTTNLIDLDSRMRMTMFANGGHNSWDRAYANPDMWNWLFSWKLGGKLISAEPVPEPTPTPVPPPAPVEKKEVKVDFGLGTLTLNSEWNDVGQKIKKDVHALKDSRGNPTGITLRALVLNPKAVNYNGATTTPAALNFPKGATQDSFVGDVNAPLIRYEIGGLDPSKTYEFQFFASRMSVRDNRTTLFTLNNGSNIVAGSLDAVNNADRVAATSGIKPSPEGVLILDVQKGPGNTSKEGFFYIGNMVIKY